ncbi:Uncharacterized protein TCM_027902 [Theobroma cacao]|uniref:Uncharacterized protein n=1 Tax=Theobroma cacao TaxID=3641 RepID=A0A061G937_THECC|nr:Uncharacterized protein TCM_027902 [Theobroma cacao]
MTRNFHQARDNRRDVSIDTHYSECRSKPRKIGIGLACNRRRVRSIVDSGVHRHEIVRRDVNSNHTSEDTLRASPTEESFENSESLESEDSSDTSETVRNFLLKQSEEWERECTRKAIARGDIHPRKVSGVRHFPLGCGIGAALVSVEEYKRIQQAWIKEQRRKSQEEEEDPKEDPSMCPDQDDENPKDT